MDFPFAIYVTHAIRNLQLAPSPIPQIIDTVSSMEMCMIKRVNRNNGVNGIMVLMERVLKLRLI
jgi:hypothetical protein